VRRGIRPDGTYVPLTEEQESTGVLQIRTLEIKVAKISSVPMKDFAAMLKGEKKLNQMGEWMKVGQEDFENNAPRLRPP
jgi:hypothetical protein